MKYFQCSKCKILKTIDETDIKYQTYSELDIIKFTPDITCHERRMRNLTKDQYDHEIIQRDYIDGKGPAPVNTVLMTEYNIK